MLAEAAGVTGVAAGDARPRDSLENPRVKPCITPSKIKAAKSNAWRSNMPMQNLIIPHKKNQIMFQLTIGVTEPVVLCAVVASEGVGVWIPWVLKTLFISSLHADVA